MRFWGFGLLSLLLLCSHGICDFNYRAHQREKMWLWMMYNFVCDQEGPANQKLIYPQNPDHSHTDMKNIGTGPGKRFTYAEFISRASGYNAANAVPEGTIRDPIVHGIDAALDDMGKQYGGLMKIKHLNPRSVVMHEVWNAIHSEYLRYHGDPKRKGLLSKLGPLMDRLSADIYFLRLEDSHKFIAENLGEGKNGKKAIIPNAVINKKIPSQVPGGPAYSQIDITETLRKNTNSDGTLKSEFGFETREKFSDHIKTYGKPAKKKPSKDSKPPKDNKLTPSETHYEMKKVWSDTAFRTSLNPDGTRNCPVNA